MSQHPLLGALSLETRERLSALAQQIIDEGWLPDTEHNREALHYLIERLYRRGLVIPDKLRFLAVKFAKSALDETGRLNINPP